MFVGLMARQSKQWENQMAQILRATIGGPEPESIEQKWRRVVAFQEKWITGASPRGPDTILPPLEQVKTQPAAINDRANESTPPPKNGEEDDVAERVRRAMEAPKKYPMMEIAEAAHALKRHPSTIHRLKGEGKIQGRGGRILTESVIAYMTTTEAD